MIMNKVSILLTCALFAQVACKSDELSQQPQVPDSAEPVGGIRIAWDYTTRKQLSPIAANYSGYARMIRLTNGSLFCVFESDGFIKSVVSTNAGETWSDPVTIASPENDIPCYVPEILELEDKSLLVSYNMRPRGDYTDESKRFSIRVKRSTDSGMTWSDHNQIYTAGHEFKNGCWEPAQVQLPSDEIQLYIANEGPYTQSNEQEISMFRSFDNGVSWSDAETVSFRKNFRDGMPVPLVLQNGDIIFAIEDNGIQPPEFKPAIIRTTFKSNWSNAPVLETSP